LFRAVVEAAAEAILVAGPDVAAPGPPIEYVNAAFCRLTGLAATDVVGTSLEDLPAPRTDPAMRRALRAALEAGEAFRGDIAGHRRGKDGYVAELLVSPVRDAQGAVRHWLALARDVTEQRRAEAAMREETRTLELLNRTGAQLAAELDLQKLIQAVTDTATNLSGARFGAFFYADAGDEDGHLMPYVLSGASREVFAGLPLPRATKVFAPTLHREAVVRSDDITRDPRYGANTPHAGMPAGHLPVRSYLAVPVVSRSGAVLGTLFFGHPEPGVFTERAERIVTGIAGQAAVAIDNARLYAAVQADIAERERVATRQELLVRELNHRVNNTLSIVQTLAMQTLRGEGPVEERIATFQRRLLALAKTHALLTRESWSGASLRALVEAELEPYGGAADDRVQIVGEDLSLPAEISVVLGMALHELATNAVRHGALAVPQGRVRVHWQRSAAERRRLLLCWQEQGGAPPRASPTRTGFGTRLLRRSLARQLRGAVSLRFEPDGLFCSIEMLLPPPLEA